MRSEILTRYAEQRLPRYTSYPTAAQFGSQVGEATTAPGSPSSQTGSPVRFIFTCRSAGQCAGCGCHTTVARRDGPLAGYLHALHQEIALVAASLGRRLAIDHVHFGGGTPTILQPEDLLRLVARLRATFPISAHAEMAIEIDPISARSRRRAFRKRALATSRRKPSGRRSSPPVTGIGLDHYALPGDSMAVAQDRGTLRRNFQGYTTDRSDVLLAFGASAIGRLPQGYVQNEVVLGRYAERLRRATIASGPT